MASEVARRSGVVCALPGFCLDASYFLHAPAHHEMQPHINATLNRQLAVPNLEIKR